MASLPKIGSDVMKLLETAPYVVELDVYSGRPNPIVAVHNEDEMAPFKDHLAFQGRMTSLSDSLGYRGFKVHKRTPLVMASQAGQTTKTASQIGSHMMTIGKGTNAELEKLLLKKFSGLDETLITHITTAQQPGMEVGGGGRGRDVGVGGGGRDVGVGGGGPGIVVDQDLYQMPAYNPSPWNDDEHVLEHNNCYNYATNKVTNTFAQPGRASHYKPVGPIKADVVRKECYSDGYKKRQDGGQPSKNQNTGPVALVFWPNADGSMHDFHFFRMDSNKMWSHKPGSTKVKNTDNARQLINDPQTAAISPYDFVCYLGNNAKVNIN